MLLYPVIVFYPILQVTTQPVTRKGTVYAILSLNATIMAEIKTSRRIKAAVGITLGVIAGIVVWWVIASIIWGRELWWDLLPHLRSVPCFLSKKTPQPLPMVAKVAAMN